ncbi:hypothetical protein [Streptomyces murinus]|uniref:Uncharacterized protein n=1 Tax=Streptomyces murinus TaxID=33900 RepID=A0A7W3NHY3_STRMR|nr:hypothetical protein [Streptomyces murinus]MBA9050876.1 hypothetical protein [Streptomyces murinus]
MPEQLVMRTYCARYAADGGFDLPALIPQVYLHYDPLHPPQRQAVRRAAPPAHGFPALGPGPCPHRHRGRRRPAHYGRPNPPDDKGRITHTAVPRLYAEMVAEDRRLRLAGYEIYRFGGWELTQPHAEQLVADFFTELLARHQKPAL